MELVAKNDMMIDLCSARDLEIKQLKASNSLLLEEQNSMQKEIVACKLEQERCSDNKEVDRIITELEGVGESFNSVITKRCRSKSVTRAINNWYW